jgi:hypothetical protein
MNKERICFLKNKKCYAVSTIESMDKGLLNQMRAKMIELAEQFNYGIDIEII